MTDSTLLPCPFCGGKADWGYHDCSHGDYTYCTDCGVEVSGTAEMWNRRPPQPVVDASQPQQGAVAAIHIRPHQITLLTQAADAGVLISGEVFSQPGHDTVPLYTGTIGQQAVDDAELAEFVRGIYQRMNESYEGGRRILFQDMDYLFDFATKRRIILSQVPAALAAHGKGG